MKLAIEVTEISSSLYRARCPSLPGCLVLGPSLEEAQERMLRAIRAYVASLDVPDCVELHVHVRGVVIPPDNSKQPAIEAGTCT